LVAYAARTLPGYGTEVQLRDSRHEAELHASWVKRQTIRPQESSALAYPTNSCIFRFMHVVIDIPDDSLPQLKATLANIQGRIVHHTPPALEEWVRAELDLRLAESEATDIPLETFLDRFRDRGL
jgi:hypothetical protein